MTHLTREQVEQLIARFRDSPNEYLRNCFMPISDTDAALREWVADLRAKLAKVMKENADMKVQLTQESQDAINKQVIIDGLRSERARHTQQAAKETP